jgi:outer membrane biosynthesis protein TonB
MSDRQKLFYALLASALVHVLLFASVGWAWAVTHAQAVEKSLPDLSQLTVTIMPAPKSLLAPAVAAKPAKLAPPPPVLVTQPRPDLDSDGLTKSAKAPAKALFQSDSNMVAGSQLPASGNLPLPGIAGPQRSFTDFANRQAAMGKGQGEQPASAGRASSPELPMQTPSAVTQVAPPPAFARQPPQARPTPQAQQPPQAQPTPRPVPTPARDSLALGKPTPTPAPPEQFAKLNMAPPSMRPEAEVAPMPKPAAPPRPPGPPVPPATQTLPKPPSPSRQEPGVQRELNRTRVDGGIATPGAPGVDAVESPYGRYHRTINNIIGSRWNLYMQETPKDVGEVVIKVRINPNGTVSSTEVVDNHSNDGLADLSVRSIMDSKFPPVPVELALSNGKFEINFTFTVYDPKYDPSGR